MTEQLKQLMEFQNLDNQVHSIEDALRSSTVRKKLLHARNYIATAQENLAKMEGEIAELQALLETVRAKYAASCKRLEEMQVHFEAADEESYADDVQDMCHQANSIVNEMARQEKELNGLMKRIASIDQEFKKMATNIPKAKQDYADLKVSYDKELASVQAQTAPLKEQMAALEKRLPAQLMARYKVARQSSGSAIVLLNGTRCSGCHMDLPSVTAKAIREQGIGECENCGRILYTEN